MTPQQQPEDSRNTMIFLVCAMVLFVAYYFFVEQPQERRMREAARQHAAAVAAQTAQSAPQKAAPTPLLSPEQVRRQGGRVQIDTDALKGTINLNGALLDDLQLKRYPQTTDRGSPPVELFRPVGADHAYYAAVIWSGAPGAPDVTTPWRQVGGGVLSKGHPVDLEFDAASGLSYRRHIEVDDNYMFTVTDTVKNTTPQPLKAQLWAVVVRQGLPADVGKANAFEGALGVFPTAAGDKLDLTGKQQGYRDLQKKLEDQRKEFTKRGEDPSRANLNFVDAAPATGGWYGLTDKYWLGAVIPAQQNITADKGAKAQVGTPVTGELRVDSGEAVDRYSGGFHETGAHAIPAGGQVSSTVKIFAGAKKDQLLQQYGRDFHIPNFRNAIDWGGYGQWILTQGLFWLFRQILNGVHAVFTDSFTGAVGLSILLLTVVVRGAMFPLALQSYASMSKMKKVQPLVEEMRKKFKDDPAKQQQEMMALYQREKINPIAGCLPMLATIPVFFALYKMLFVTIEMRQAPFLWIRDLADKDPTTVFNLFGLLPYDPAHLPVIGFLFASYLHFGVWPILYGFTTFLQMQMSPASPDPTQQTMMKIMPFMFMIFLAGVPVGLLIYYVWSNIITIGQQWFMMNRHGVENPIDGFIARVTGKAVKVQGKASG
jgi:YidC/Oxa1 family membrane protein insertase